MKTRRKLEPAIQDLKRFALSPNREALGMSSCHVIWNLEAFRDRLSGDPDSMRDLLETSRLLSAGSGPGQGRAEEDLFRFLVAVADDCYQELDEHDVSISAEAEAVGESVRRHWAVLRELARHAEWCLQFRKSRDAFGGRRRVAAFEILSFASGFMDLPEAVRWARELEKSRRDDGVAAMDFLNTYYQERGAPEEALDSPSILQLKITLRRIYPPIWRRFLVPNDIYLDELHYIVNRVMGWDNSHSHLFRFGRIQYAGWETVQACGPPLRHDDDCILAALIKHTGRVFEYRYDFGDGWKHEIEVEKILPPDPDLILPVCVAGERACPPEDCGGPGGYDRIVEAVRSSDPALRQFREWAGPYDPERFDLDEVNSRLRPNRC